MVILVIQIWILVQAKLILVGKIDTGVGNLNLNLIGKDYKIEVDKGLGIAKINGNEVSDGQVLGNGNVFVFVDGGIGTIDINYAK